MKKNGIIFLIIGIICLTVVFFAVQRETTKEYLRIHVRANSNEISDQEVKYQIKDILVDLVFLGAIILVGADLVRFCGDSHQIHHAVAAKGTHSVLEVVLLVLVGNDAQRALVGPELHGLFTDVAVNGQQGRYAKISALDIVLFQKREDQVAVEVHQRCLHTR